MKHAIFARATSTDWEAVRGHSYTMTEADFVDGCHTMFNPCSGVLIATGENKLGITVTAPLGVPLCSGCDNPIPATGCCDWCQVIHADVGAVA